MPETAGLAFVLLEIGAPSDRLGDDAEKSFRTGLPGSNPLPIEGGLAGAVTPGDAMCYRPRIQAQRANAAVRSRLTSRLVPSGK